VFHSVEPMKVDDQKRNHRCPAMPAGIEMKCRTTGMNRAMKSENAPDLRGRTFRALEVALVRRRYFAAFKHERLPAEAADHIREPASRGSSLGWCCQSRAKVHAVPT